MPFKIHYSVATCGLALITVDYLIRIVRIGPSQSDALYLFSSCNRQWVTYEVLFNVDSIENIAKESRN